MFSLVVPLESAMVCMLNEERCIGRRKETLLSLYTAGARVNASVGASE